MVDIDARQIASTVPVGRDPYGASLSPDGRQIYTGNLADNSVSVIDVATLKVTATIEGFKQPRQAIVFTRDGRYAYVLNEDLSIAKVDRSLLRITSTLPASAHSRP
ncbi:YVTN family beta-propeller protein [Comamonas sp. 4034]